MCQCFQTSCQYLVFRKWMVQELLALGLQVLVHPRTNLERVLRLLEQELTQRDYCLMEQVLGYRTSRILRQARELQRAPWMGQASELQRRILLGLGMIQTVLLLALALSHQTNSIPQREQGLQIHLELVLWSTREAAGVAFDSFWTEYCVRGSFLGIDPFPGR